ncbi:hypothetical protein X474_20335 [Dethiosulfatarculus sandiegensis]|uniref:Uncharacterized protein n=1 Tax=Dethiosulfatarculus sandiegensis TaxID=1429043 RepID=A0A0D2J9B8_9BACT|nr:hypothetical protein X474_20335 [Dethiosulfatarculus sandiegensis]
MVYFLGLEIYLYKNSVTNITNDIVFPNGKA